MKSLLFILAILLSMNLFGQFGLGKMRAANNRIGPLRKQKSGRCLNICGRPTAWGSQCFDPRRGRNMNLDLKVVEGIDAVKFE